MKKRSLLHTAMLALIVLLHTGFSHSMAEEAPAAPAVVAPADATVAPAATTSADAETEADTTGQPEIGEMDISTLAGKILGVPQGTVQDVHIEATYPQLDLQRRWHTKLQW